MQSQRYARDQEHSTHVLRHLTLADPVPCNFDYCPPMSPGLAWPETSAVPSPADSLTPSYIVPSGLRKSKTPGPLVPPLWIQPLRGRIHDTSGRRTSPIPHNKLSNDYRICWSRPGATSSERQRSEIHRAVSRHTTLLEERR